MAIERVNADELRRELANSDSERAYLWIIAQAAVEVLAILEDMAMEVFADGRRSRS